MSRLGKKEGTRIFVVGPPGSQSKEIATALSEHFLFDKISLGEILTSESNKDTELSSTIKKTLNDYRMVSDAVAIEAVKGKIPHGTEIESSYVIEGFPKNKVQSLQLQKLGIIPDKFILLNVDDEVALDHIKISLKKYGSTAEGEELEKAAQESLDEYKMNIKGVRESYEGFYYEIDMTDAVL